MSFNNTFLWDEKGNIYGGKPERFVSMKKCVYIILMKEEHQLQYKHNEVFVLAKLRLIKILTLHSDSTLKYNSIFPPFFFLDRQTRIYIINLEKNSPGEDATRHTHCIQLVSKTDKQKRTKYTKNNFPFLTSNSTNLQLHSKPIQNNAIKSMQLNYN